MFLPNFLGSYSIQFAPFGVFGVMSPKLSASSARVDIRLLFIYQMIQILFIIIIMKAKLGTTANLGIYHYYHYYLQ